LVDTRTVVMQVILLDTPLRTEIEEYLRAGGYLVTRLGQAPLDARLAVVVARTEITPREREVLDALLRHDTAREIAQELGVSARTVQDHLQHLQRRFNVRSWHRLVVEAARVGLIELVASGGTSSRS
jgi:DNA-binding CsgD family transcriptional regulator